MKMKKHVKFVFSVLALLNLQIAFAGPEALNNGEKWSATDPLLRSGDLTVWKLQEMAHSGAEGLQEIDRLFSQQSVSLDSLPLGYSAGTGARVFGLGNGPLGEMTKWMGLLLDEFTGHNWRGKIFFNCGKNSSHGLNRIRFRAFLKDQPSNDVVAMAKFNTHLLDAHPLTKDARSNLVVLNYADPITQEAKRLKFANLLNPAFWSIGYWQELALKTVAQVYDVMVAVPGKYGPIYIGKTWYGRYDEFGEFSAFNPDSLVARYFLDFNPDAVKVQKEDPYWKGGVEKDLHADPLFTCKAEQDED